MARMLSATKPRCSRRRPTARDSDAPPRDRATCSWTSNMGCTTVSLAVLSIASRKPQDMEAMDKTASDTVVHSMFEVHEQEHGVHYRIAGRLVHCLKEPSVPRRPRSLRSGSHRPPESL